MITAKIECSFLKGVAPLHTFHDCQQFPGGLLNRLNLLHDEETRPGGHCPWIKEARRNSLILTTALIESTIRGKLMVAAFAHSVGGDHGAGNITDDFGSSSDLARALCG
jgi:hypothetical protein